MRLTPGEPIVARSVIAVSPDESHTVIDDLYITCVLPPPQKARESATYLVTCGHCLPQQATLRVGSVQATSGFDEEGEGAEIGIIRLHPQYTRRASNRIGRRGETLSLARPPASLLRRCLVPSSTTLFNLCRGQRQYGVLLACIVDVQNMRRGRHGACAVTLRGHKMGASLVSACSPLPRDAIVIDHSIDKINPPFALVAARSRAASPDARRVQDRARELIARCERARRRAHRRTSRTSCTSRTTSCTSRRRRSGRPRGFAQTKSGTPWIVGTRGCHYLLGAHIGKTVAVGGNNLHHEAMEVAYVKIHRWDTPLFSSVSNT